MEPVFIKCEPGWETDTGEPSDFETTASNLVEVKQEPLSDVEEGNAAHQTTPISEDQAISCDISDIKTEELFIPDSDQEEDDLKNSLFEERNDSGDPETDVVAGGGEGLPGISGMKREGKESLYCCDKCDKAFTRRGNLRSHMLLHTGVAPHSCSACGKIFTLSSHLRRHMVTHTGARPYSCTLCDKSFSQRENLNGHMLYHTGARPHTCPVCDKRFVRRSHLNSHMFTHSAERPHVCSICGKTFNQRSALLRHLAGHSGLRSHTCSICEKSFTQRPHLKRHMLTHTGERAHSCSLCGKSFVQRGTLKTHMFTHTRQLTKDVTFPAVAGLSGTDG